MKFPTLRALRALVIDVKHEVPRDDPDYIQDDDTEESIDLTIGHSPKDGTWSYQTGDNSFSGAAYSYPNWAVTTIYRSTNAAAVARDLRDQLEELAEGEVK